MIRWRIGPLGPFLLALLLIVAACGEGGEAPSPEGGTETPAAEGTPQTPSAQETPAPQVQLPAGFPEDFPLYNGAQLTQSAQFENQIIVRLETDDPRPQVADFFQEALNQAPWEVLGVDEIEREDTTGIRFASRDGAIEGAVTVRRETLDGESTLIFIRVLFPAEETPTPAGEATPTPEEGQGQ